MIKESTLEQNVNIYLSKMEQKLIEDYRKIQQLKDKINNAACKIQKTYRKFIFYKKTRAARKIQKFWKKIIKIIEERRKKLYRFVQFFSSYKIFYFFKAIKKKQNKIQKHQIQPFLRSFKYQSLLILNNVKTKCTKYIVFVSSLQAELAYLKKYALYDRKMFTQQWEAHEKKQREWMWAQIKKKWIKKDANIWINESQKQVNAENYVNTLIEQTYMKQYERFEHSQQRINDNYESMKGKSVALKQIYYLSLFK